MQPKSAEDLFEEHKEKGLPLAEREQKKLCEEALSGDIRSIRLLGMLAEKERYIPASKSIPVLTRLLRQPNPEWQYHAIQALCNARIRYAEGLEPYYYIRRMKDADDPFRWGDLLEKAVKILEPRKDDIDLWLQSYESSVPPEEYRRAIAFWEGARDFTELVPTVVWDEEIPIFTFRWSTRSSSRREEPPSHCFLEVDIEPEDDEVMWFLRDPSADIMWFGVETEPLSKVSGDFKRACGILDRPNTQQLLDRMRGDWNALEGLVIAHVESRKRIDPFWKYLELDYDQERPIVDMGIDWENGGHVILEMNNLRTDHIQVESIPFKDLMDPSWMEKVKTNE